MKKVRLARLLAIGTVLGSMALATAPTNAVGPAFTVIASGLDNPRGVAPQRRGLCGGSGSWR